MCAAVQYETSNRFQEFVGISRVVLTEGVGIVQGSPTTLGALATPPTDQVEHRTVLILVGQFPGRHKKIAEIHAASGLKSSQDVT